MQQRMHAFLVLSDLNSTGTYVFETEFTKLAGIPTTPTSTSISTTSTPATSTVTTSESPTGTTTSTSSETDGIPVQNIWLLGIILIPILRLARKQRKNNQLSD